MCNTNMIYADILHFTKKNNTHNIYNAIQK